MRFLEKADKQFVEAGGNKIDHGRGCGTISRRLLRGTHGQLLFPSANKRYPPLRNNWRMGPHHHQISHND